MYVLGLHGIQVDGSDRLCFVFLHIYTVTDFRSKLVVPL